LLSFQSDFSPKNVQRSCTDENSQTQLDHRRRCQSGRTLLGSVSFRVFGGPNPDCYFYCPRNTRKDAKFLKPEIDSFLASGREALEFQSRVMAEVHQQTQLATRASRRRSFLSPTKHTKRREIFRAGDRGSRNSRLRKSMRLFLLFV
jgi:hypothetical protein